LTYHDQRQQQTQRGRGLDEGREVAALVGRCVFRHIDGGTTVLTAQCQTLRHAQQDQDDRGGHANAFVVGQHADEEGRQAHDDDGHQEGVLAADHVAQHAEHQRAERTHDEAGSKGQQRKDVAGVLGEGGEELRPDDGGQSAVEVEVVPLEDGAGR
jgi:hypothetical protein